MQRQELTVRGAQGEAKKLVELSVPAKYRWVPDGLLGDSRYNVAQLYAAWPKASATTSRRARASRRP
jgi:hypothetical protein